MKKTPPPEPQCAYHSPLPCKCVKPAVTPEDVEMRRKADEHWKRTKERWKLDHARCNADCWSSL